MSALRLFSCSRCAKEFWQRPDLFTGFCHACSGDCLLAGPWRFRADSAGSRV